MLTLDFEVFVHVVLVVVDRRHESLPRIDSDSSMHPVMNYSPQSSQRTIPSQQCMAHAFPMEQVSFKTSLRNIARKRAPSTHSIHKPHAPFLQYKPTSSPYQQLLSYQSARLHAPGFSNLSHLRSHPVISSARPSSTPTNTNGCCVRKVIEAVVSSGRS